MALAAQLGLRHAELELEPLADLAITTINFEPFEFSSQRAQGFAEGWFRSCYLTHARFSPRSSANPGAIGGATLP